MKLSQIVSDKRVIICGGSGGVGKTTLSAALGVYLAGQGKRAVVITIDPAQRLADALGIAMQGGTLVEVPLTDGGSGSLHALMLRPDRAVESFMQKLLGQTDRTHPFISERFFQQGMAMLAASPEYLAVQELDDLSQRPEFDVIVLDTPPTRQSIDFLTAPNRLAQALQQKSVVLQLVRPYLRLNRAGFNLVKVGAKVFLGIIDKLFGVATFEEFFSFFEVCVKLLDFDQLEVRIRKVNAMLQDPSTTFLVVAAPTPVSIEEALYFHRKIASYQIAFGGFLINRVQPAVPSVAESLQQLKHMRQELPEPGRRSFPQLGTLPSMLPKLIDNAMNYVKLRQLEQSEIARLASILSSTECLAQVPRLEQDVHDLGGIRQITTALRDGSGEERPAISGRG